MEISKDLVAASATPLILSILEQGDSYGYAIIKRVGELSGNRLLWKDGMLYPLLHRLEEQGLVESYWKESDARRKRKYYRLNKGGRKELTVQRAQWLVIADTLSNSWGNRNEGGSRALGDRPAFA